MQGKRAFATFFCSASFMGFIPFAQAGGHDHDGAIHVPGDFATIQEAVAAARPGDEIQVGPGEFCGAVLDKKVHLVGHDATIVGCPEPVVNGLRAGFFLPDASSDGSSIEQFRFDGEGVSNADLEPLAFAVFGRTASDVTVEHNSIVGTAQAITNTGGSRWQVIDNWIVGLTALTCEAPGRRCGGGAGIVFQQRSAVLPRAEDNLAAGNHIDTSIPDGLDEFEMAGLFVQGQSGATVVENRIKILDNPAAAAFGVGVLVTNTCCQDPDEPPQPLPTSKDTQILKNCGRQVDFAVFVTTDNVKDLVVKENRGRVVIGEELPPLGSTAAPGDALADLPDPILRLSGGPTLFE